MNQKIDFNKPLETLDGQPLVIVKDSVLVPGAKFVSLAEGDRRRRSRRVRINDEGYEVSSYRQADGKKRINVHDQYARNVEPVRTPIDFTRPIVSFPNGDVQLEYVGPSAEFDRFYARAKCLRRTGEPGPIRIVDGCGFAAGEDDIRLGEQVLKNAPPIEDGCYGAMGLCSGPVGVNTDAPCVRTPIDWTKPLETSTGLRVEYVSRKGDNNLGPTRYPHLVRVFRLDNSLPCLISVTEDGLEYEYDSNTGFNIRNRLVPTVNWDAPIQTAEGYPARDLGRIATGRLVEIDMPWDLGGTYVTTRAYDENGCYIGKDCNAPQRIVNAPVKREPEVSYAVEYGDNSGRCTHQGPAWSSEDAAVGQMIRELQEKINQMTSKRKIIRYVDGKRDVNWTRKLQDWKLVQP